MAEAKTIKRRGFLKALPLAGMAVATPAAAVAVENVAPSVAGAEWLAEQAMLARRAAQDAWDRFDEAEHDRQWRRMVLCARAAAIMPMDLEMADAIRPLMAGLCVSHGPYQKMHMAENVREAIIQGVAA